MDIKKAIQQMKTCYEEGCGILNCDNRDYINFVLELMEKYRDGRLVEVIRCEDCKWAKDTKDYDELIDGVLHCQILRGNEEKNCWHKKDKIYNDLSCVKFNNYCDEGEAKEGSKP